MYHEKVSIPAKYRYFADSADFGPKIASDCAQTRLRAQKMTILTEFSRENREENRGGCREKRKGKQTGCERQTLFSPTQALACALAAHAAHACARPRTFPRLFPVAV